MKYPLELLIQIARGFAKQFGPDCEILIHDLTAKNLERSIVYIENGHVTHRQVGDGPSRVVLEAAEALQNHPDTLQDQLGYLTKTSDGRILRSSTMYIRDENGRIRYLLSVNYDITGLIAFDHTIRALIETENTARTSAPEPIVTNVNDLLDTLIDQSVQLVGKPAVLMNKEEKIKAIQFLNDAGAFLITKSGDKISKYFGISKFTLYSYIDVNNHSRHDEDCEKKHA